MKSEVNLYAELLEFLDKRPSDTQLKTLCVINENRRFCVQDLMDTMNRHRCVFYPAIRYFMRNGLVEKLPLAQLPEGSEEWSVRRRKTYRKRNGMDVRPRQYYRFNPRNMIKTIDKKIE